MNSSSNFSKLCILIVLSFFFIIKVSAATELLLKDNLKRAQTGDYLVIAQNKNYNVLLIKSKTLEQISIEEITLPSNRTQSISWRSWVENGAPGHTSWIMYTIKLPEGTMHQVFSFSKNEWITIPQSQNFLSTLLNLHLRLIPENERKKIGPAPSSDSQDRRSLWQPKLVIDGKTLPGVFFDGWRTRWPKDNSDLSGRIIEVYIPKENDKYPSYFPFWLQVNGLIGKGKVRIIDSGARLYSPSRSFE